MRTPKLTDSQIMAVLKQAEGGTPVPALCREHNISSATFYKWRARFGGMDVSLMARLRELEDENAEIADWLIRLTNHQKNWGFGLCYLFLRNVKGFGWNHKRVIRVRNQIIEWRGKPQKIRCDNGPEYISHTLKQWAG